MAARVPSLLGDPDPLVRESAVEIAGYFGYASCVDGCSSDARDAVETVRAAALEHLAFLDDDRVLPCWSRRSSAIRRAARAAAAQALAHVERRTAAARCGGRSSDPDPWVRYFTLRASAGERRDARLPRSQLLGAHDDPRQHVRIAAVDAIGAMRRRRRGRRAERVDASRPDADVATAARAGARRGRRRRGARAAAQARCGATDAGARVAAADGARARMGARPAVARLHWTAAADASRTVARRGDRRPCAHGSRDGGGRAAARR